MKILSDSTIRLIETDLEAFEKAIQKSINATNTMINEFETNDTVKSLFISGGFGDAQKKELERVKQALIEYDQTISTGLIPETRTYLNNQKLRTQGE